ncbi:TonB-dependent receptor [Pedobacter sp. ASV1-7]|uniref:TonB-dependent receptor domain-containing protein n=1 Tax=Pedobacter sp. ASV1-7 TaxID=3145237 RepID=UPI0032E900BB
MNFYQLMRVMKITMVLMTCLLVQLSAATYGQRLSINKQSVSLADLLEEISEKTGYDFFYDAEIFDGVSKVSVNVKNADIEKVLSTCFANLPFDYMVKNKIVTIRKISRSTTGSPNAAPVRQQPGHISGKVVDDRGEPLPGATVKIVQNNQSVQSSVDGKYNFSLPPGSYTIEVSYISFQTKRITGVEVKPGELTSLNIVLNTATNQLSQVVVTGSYKKESIAGLYAEQKNRASVSNGISAEQISATPDKNIGESLKRISGVSSMDNKFVLVRGIGERYNSAMLDGTVLPSTEAQNRTFSFDLIPSNMVENVVVNKTVTPDMNASFGGGLIQINTKDIPNENFMSFSAGVSYNDQSAGEDFLSHKRGKYDYLAFDDGRRDFPKDLFPVLGLDFSQEKARITEQSKRFVNDNFSVYNYTAAPSQNYQFTIGRLFTLDTANSATKFGFTGSVSYRNHQQINHIEETRRGNWHDDGNNTGNSFGFNTTWGGLLNMGLQVRRHKFSLRNTYTRIFDNTLVRTLGYNDNMPLWPEATSMQKPNLIEEVDDPTYTTLLQNKLAGQHQLNKVKLEWEFARTAVDRKEKDLGIAEQILRQVSAEYDYFYTYSSLAEPRIKPISRQNYHNSEQNYSWNVAATLPFKLGTLSNTVKAGYFGLQKKAKFEWQSVSMAMQPLGTIKDSLLYLPIGEAIKPENMGAQGFLFMPWYTDYYEGKSKNHAGYLMLDNRFTDQLRLVWGIRAEYYDYKELNNALNGKTGQFGSLFTLKPEKRWQLMPSANLTYSPLSALNLRAAYSSSMVRPEMMDNSQFFRYSPYLGGMYGSDGLYSTRIDSWDFKTEWFPELGEILSVGVFYKKFDKPAELTYQVSEMSGAYNFILKSSDWAKVYGLEFELRKSLGFIYDNKMLNNLTAYSNLTLQKSELKSTYLIQDPNDPAGGQVQVTMKQNRSMYGQSPYLLNAGLQYAADRLGLNIAYNKSGLKTVMVSDVPNEIQYEQPREQLDAQISYRFLQKRLEVKLNAGNILNTASTIYRNFGSYERNPDFEFNGDNSNAMRLKEGFTDKYEEGDLIMFKQRFGRTFSTSLTYNF